MADTAGQQEQNKFAALQSMAAGNSYDAGSDQIKQSQSAALSGLASQAAKINAPQAATDQWSAVASGPYDAALANLAAGHGQQASSNAALDRIWSDYSAAAANAPAYGKALTSGSSAAGGANAWRGGYANDGAYENAVTSLAQQAVQQAAADAQAQHDQIVQAYNTDPLYVQNQRDEQNTTQRRRFLQGEADESRRNANQVASESRQAWNTSGDTTMAGYGQAHAAAYDAQAQQDAMQRNYENAVKQQQLVAQQGLAQRALYAPRWEQATTTGQQVQDPANLYQFAREQAINTLGGDPADAMSRFSPTWAMGLATGDLKGASSYATQQQEYSERTANSQAGYGPYTNRELQAMQPSGAQQQQQVMGTPEYQQAAAQAEGLLQQATAGAAAGTPVTSDDLKAMLAQDGYPADVAAAIVATYGPLFPSSSFYSRPATFNQAAAAG